MNKSLVTLIILAFFLFAAGIYAGWREDMKRGGIDTAGNKVTTIKPTKVGSSGTSISQLTVGKVTFTNAATTHSTYTLAGVSTADVVQVQAAATYSGTAYIENVTLAANKFIVEWSADPGTTVPLSYVWYKLH